MREIIMRAWLYFRTGYGLYFSLFLGILSSAVTVYYLMIESVPALKTIFPSFEIFLIIGGFVGLPIITIWGWVHYKRIQAFGIEQRVMAESSPYLVDSTALFSSLLCIAENLGLENEPEFIKLRNLVEAKNQ